MFLGCAFSVLSSWPVLPLFTYEYETSVYNLKSQWLLTKFCLSVYYLGSHYLNFNHKYKYERALYPFMGH